MIVSDGDTGSSSSSRCNVVVLGSGSVGKSCLVIQFVQGVFVQHYDPTIMDVLIKGDSIDGSTTTVSLVDTTGQREFADHRAPYIRDADGVVFVFSVVDRNSLQELPVLLDEVVKARASSSRPDCPFIVAGNKIDLEPHRVVATNEGEKFSELAWKKLSGGQPPLGSTNMLPYLETSAKIAGDARLLIHTIVRMIRRFKQSGRVQNLEEVTPRPSLASSAPPAEPTGGAVPIKSSKKVKATMGEGTGTGSSSSATASGLLEFPEAAEIPPSSAAASSPVASPSSSVTSLPVAAQKKKKKSCTMI